jgi:hypothetical protein
MSDSGLDASKTTQKLTSKSYTDNYDYRITNSENLSQFENNLITNSVVMNKTISHCLENNINNNKVNLDTARNCIRKLTSYQKYFFQANY